MFKGINKKNIIFMYDDVNFFYFFLEILVYFEGFLEISFIWGLMKVRKRERNVLVMRN